MLFMRVRHLFNDALDSSCAFIRSSDSYSIRKITTVQYLGFAKGSLGIQKSYGYHQNYTTYNSVNKAKKF